MDPPTNAEGTTISPAEEADDHADPPSVRTTVRSLVLLLLALIAVVGLAKIESPAVEAGVRALAAVRAARRGRVQISLNLGYGSALASIGLTIPTIAVASIWLPQPLELGLGPTQMCCSPWWPACSPWRPGGPPGCRAWCTWRCSPRSCSWRPTRSPAAR